jgi:hypothetical protein
VASWSCGFMDLTRAIESGGMSFSSWYLCSSCVEIA